MHIIRYNVGIDGMWFRLMTQRYSSLIRAITYEHETRQYALIAGDKADSAN